MNLGLDFTVTTPPATEPVTLDLLRKQVRDYSESTEEDALLQTYLAVAREMIESETGRALLSQTITATWDRFPHCSDFNSFTSPRMWRRLEVPRSPLRSVTSFEYRDADGNWQDVPAGDYEVSPAWAEPGYVQLTPEASWPSDLWAGSGRIRLVYVAGHEHASRVNRALVSAILLQAAILYDVRMPLTGAPMRAANRTIETLIAQNRVKWL